MTRFSNGIGRLTAPHLNGFLDTAHRVATHGDRQTDVETYGPITGKVSGSSQMDTPHTGKWLYTITEVVFETDRTSTDLTTSGSAIQYTNAINLAEMGNTTTVHNGVTIADLPGTIALQPIANDTHVLFWIRGNRETSGNRYTAYFSQPGEFDGDCS